MDESADDDAVLVPQPAIIANTLQAPPRQAPDFAAFYSIMEAVKQSVITPINFGAEPLIA